MNLEIELGTNIDELLRNLPSGTLSRAINDNLYGINARSKNTPLPLSRDNYGYTFFTRPILNLTGENISKHERFISLIDAPPLSYATYVRMMLDPRLGNPRVKGHFKSPIVDNRAAFFPMLTNACSSVSGWPHLSNPTYTSPTGLYGEQMSYTDGWLNEYESFDLTCTFRNTRGQPLLYLFTLWVYYQCLVFTGELDPYTDMITEHEIDYQTRIYRLVTNSTNQYITNIFASGASFPLDIPAGAMADYDINKPYNAANDELSIRFKSMVFLHNEEHLKLEFNQTQALFNPQIASIMINDAIKPRGSDEVRRESKEKLHEVPGSGLTKVPHFLLQLSENSLLDNNYYNFNYMMYPYINLFTNELEWWVPSDKFTEVAKERMNG